MIAQLKHSNMLYELDNEVARWIIDKRKFWGI
jgi:hypothetical protein